MDETQTDNLLTITEAAKRIGVSRQTIYTWIGEGKVRPVWTPGGRPRILPNQLIVNQPIEADMQDSDVYPIRDISELEPIMLEWMGTKEKQWFVGSVKHWSRESESDLFLFKAGREGTGENWAEKVASELCLLIGLPHAEYDLAIYKGKKGVVTTNFAPLGTRLVLGNEILGRYVPEYETRRSFRHRQHKLRIVTAYVCDKRIELPLGWEGNDIIDSAIGVFVGYIMLDAWIANQDRHHENWGVIYDMRSLRTHLAPTFDHASSLGRNENDEDRESRLITRDQGRDMHNYVLRARSAFYPSYSDPKPLTTIEAFKMVKNTNQKAARYWLEQLNRISPLDTRPILNRIPKEEMSDVTLEFAQKMLELNRERLLETED